MAASPWWQWPGRRTVAASLPATPQPLALSARVCAKPRGWDTPGTWWIWGGRTAWGQDPPLAQGIGLGGEESPRPIGLGCPADSYGDPQLFPAAPRDGGGWCQPFSSSPLPPLCLCPLSAQACCSELVIRGQRLTRALLSSTRRGDSCLSVCLSVRLSTFPSLFLLPPPCLPPPKPSWFPLVFHSPAMAGAAPLAGKNGNQRGREDGGEIIQMSRWLELPKAASSLLSPPSPAPPSRTHPTGTLSEEGEEMFGVVSTRVGKSCGRPGSLSKPSPNLPLPAGGEAEAPPASHFVLGRGGKPAGAGFWVGRGRRDGMGLPRQSWSGAGQRADKPESISRAACCYIYIYLDLCP